MDESGSNRDLDRITPFQVADWTIEPAADRLVRGEHEVKLEPRVMDLLLCLASRPGEVFSREELESTVWSGMVVGYDALTSAMIKLRKAFEDDSRQPKVIETVAKRGYRLIAPVSETPPDVKIVTTANSLPITNQAYAANESLPGDIDSTRKQYRHLANNPPLIMIVATGIILLSASLWYLFYTPSDNDKPETKSTDVTSNTAHKLHGGTADIEAQNAFNAGWREFNRHTPADYKTAIVQLKRAIQLDPDFGQAHAALAAVYWNTWKLSWHILVGTSPIPRTWELADTSVQKALQYPSPLAYQVSSEMLLINRRYDDAIAEARKAIALAPDNPNSHAALARVLAFAGLPGDAEKSIKKAMQLDPHYPPSFLFTLGMIHFNTSRYDQAAAILAQAVRGSPDNHLFYVPLIAAYGHLGRRREVAPLLDEANRLRKTCQLPLLNVSLPIDPYPYAPWAFQNAADVTRLQTGLRAAGLPEW